MEYQIEDAEIMSVADSGSYRSLKAPFSFDTVSFPYHHI
jgi:hypothetical protein